MYRLAFAVWKGRAWYHRVNGAMVSWYGEDREMHACWYLWLIIRCCTTDEAVELAFDFL